MSGVLDRGSFSTSEDVGTESARYKESLAAGSCSAPLCKLGPASGADYSALGVGSSFSEDMTEIRRPALRDRRPRRLDDFRPFKTDALNVEKRASNHGAVNAVTVTSAAKSREPGERPGNLLNALRVSNRDVSTGGKPSPGLAAAGEGPLVGTDGGTLPRHEAHTRGRGGCSVPTPRRDGRDAQLFAIAVLLTPFAVGGLLACIVI